MSFILPQLGSSSLKRCCKNFSSASGRGPLSWREYFPDGTESCNCCSTQSIIGKESSSADHRLLTESLQVNHERCDLLGIKAAFQRGPVFRQRRVGDYNKQTQYFPSTFPLPFKQSSNSLDNVPVFKEISPQAASNTQSFKEKTLKRISHSSLSVPDDKQDFIRILQKCKGRRDLSLAKSVHTHVRDIGLGNHCTIGNHLVPVYVKCGSLWDAQAVFDKLGYRNVYSWTSLLFGHIQHGELVRALELYDMMQDEGVSPSSYTLVALLKVCTALREIERGRGLHILIVQKGLEGNVVVGSTLIDMYSKFYSALEAQKIFDKLLNRNVVAWSALTAAYTESGDAPGALDCFDQMLFDGIIPNAITFLSALKACNNAGLIRRGKGIHSQIVYKGLDKELYVGNTVMDLYSKGGSISDARNIFDSLLCRDVSSWNVMIQGYSMNHDNTSAIKLFETMGSFGVKPDAVTFACILSTCSRANLSLMGQELFKRMRETYLIVPSADHINCMVDLLARTGNVSEAEKLVNSSPNPATDTCRALLTACRKFIKVELGERCFFDGLSRYVWMASMHCPTASMN